jgi:LysM repeat protein
MGIRKIPLAIIGILAVVVVAAIITGLYFFLRIPHVEDQLPAGSTPVHVLIQTQDNPSGWPKNSYIPIVVQATGGGPIQSIELYINGQLYEKVDAPDAWPLPEFKHQWDWQPGATGKFIVVAKSISSAGGTGISDPIQIMVRDESISTSPYATKEGDTLNGIAAAKGVDLTQLRNANPQISDPEQLIPSDTQIFVPNPPVLITNPKVIPGLEEPAKSGELQPIESSGVSLPDTKGGDENGQPPIPSLEDLRFWLSGKTDGASDTLPLAPIVNISYKGCELTLFINSADFNNTTNPGANPSNQEDGFFVYKSLDGEPFQRIATLPAIENAETWKMKAGYSQPNQSSGVSYAISAFNHAGESISTPVIAKFDQTSCAKKENGVRVLNPIQIENGDLFLPNSLDLAYLYLSIDGSSSFRVPEGHRMFQPNSGVKFNIYNYLSEQIPSFSAADFALSMEIWGWSGGKLQYIGKYENNVHRSVLLVCSVEGEGMCSNGNGEWTTEVNFSDQKPVNEQVFEFKWVAPNFSDTEEICIQAAASPYPDDNYWHMGFEPISAGCTYWNGSTYIHGSEGTFTEHMQNLLYPDTPPDFYGWGGGTQNFDYDSRWFSQQYPPDSEFSIYFRVLPHQVDKTYHIPFSNVVTLHHNTAPVPSELPPLASPYPSIYNIVIMQDSYEPPIFETDENWGCVIVDEDPTGHFATGQVVCPPPYGTMAKLSSDGCEGNWDVWCTFKGAYKSLADAWDAILYWYDYTKYYYASVIAETIPYCGGNEKCIGVIKMVIDKVIKEATGIPENPPKSDDLVSKNLAKLIVNSAVEAEKYYTEQDYSVIEAGCAIAKCEEKLAKAIKQQIQRQRSVAAQPACTDTYQAYFHGKDGICLDPSILVHAAPGGMNKQGMVTLEITRKSNFESTGVQPADANKYRIHVNVNGENGGLSGQLFPPQILEVPWIAPGGSTYISVPLTIIGGEINEPLYFGGISHMKALEACYSPESSVDWVPCLDGGFDSWDYQNPPDKFSLEIGQQ